MTKLRWAAALMAVGGMAGEARAQATPAQPPAKARPTAVEKQAPAAGKTEITWYGHAAFRIQTPGGKSILIDPWLDNPANPSGKRDVASVQADLILVSHGHGDHVGNAVEIGKRTKAKLVTTFDLGKALVATGFPAAQAGMDSQGNFGGQVELLDGEVTIAFVPAVHSSQVQKDDKSPGLDGGHPGGFLVMIKGGPAIYHTGDTDVFGDMALIPAHRPVDVMLACIGGHFTMDPARAARAARLVKPRTIVPMHYGTFPLLKGTPAELAGHLKKQGVRGKLVTLEIGGSFSP
jgi:L-ascorbate metabolism protein UlaG (beta-lactamase superfamily)